MGVASKDAWQGDLEDTDLCIYGAVIVIQCMLLL